MYRCDRRSLPILGLLIVLATGLDAGSAQQGSQQQPPRFRSGVDVVAIDVTVVDRTGKPVNGLTPDDFTVTVDGVPRRVMTAQFINYREGASTGGTTPAASPLGPEVAPAPVRPQAGRDVVIVIDEDSMEVEDGLLAKRCANVLLDKLGAADRVGIATIPRLRSNFSVTPDRSENRRVIANWVPGVSREMAGPYFIGLAEAVEIDRNDLTTKAIVLTRECDPEKGKMVPKGSALDPFQPAVRPNCARDVLAEARQIAARARMRGTATLAALRALGIALRQIDGPKTMVLVSGGILSPESASAYSDAAAEFAASQITLYTLFFEKTPYSAIRYRQSPSLAEDDRIEAEGLWSTTTAAGGTMLRVIGTAEPYFERVATELSAGYLLGIEVAAADRNGRPHQVEVKVGRPGLDVHGRKQYVIPVNRRPLP